MTVRGTRLAGGSSRFLLPTFLCGRQRKVGAAPHRGNANRPIAIQGKANTSNRHPLHIIAHRSIKKPRLRIDISPSISPIHATNNSPNRGGHQIGINTHPKRTPSHISASHLSHSHSARISALSQSPLFIVLNTHWHTDRVHQRIKRPITFTVQHAPRTVDLNSQLDMFATLVFGQTMSNIVNRRSTVHILLLEQFPDLRRRHFLPAVIGMTLHGRAEVDLQTARQHHAMGLLEQIGDAAFA